MSKKIKIAFVTNSLPLPEGDFLREKFFRLQEYFDVHIVCWDSQQNKDAFLKKYWKSFPEDNIHLVYDKLDVAGGVELLAKNIGRILKQPAKNTTLFKKLQHNISDTNKVLIKYNFYSLINDLEPDIVHFEFGTLARSFSDIKIYSDVKSSVSFRGYDLNYIGLEDKYYYQDVWQKFDAFHFLGNDLKERAYHRGYKGGKKEALISPAIDTDFYKREEQPENERIKIISVGRLTWKKGYEYALVAMSELKKQNVDFTYHIIGGGNHLQALQFAIQELHLSEHIVLHGSLSRHEIKKELMTADIFLHPAVSEGFSNAVIEAQSIGVPVVATNADGLAENIVDGETGYVVPIYNAQALADKVMMLINDKTLRAEMGAAGVTRARALFRIEEQVQKFKEFYAIINAS